jgi:hypothetical protein
MNIEDLGDPMHQLNMLQSGDADPGHRIASEQRLQFIRISDEVLFNLVFAK